MSINLAESRVIIDNTFSDNAGTPLTLLSSRAGCAAKIGPKELQELLGTLEIKDSDARFNLSSNEDANCVDIGNGLLLAQSVDVITPVSDDPIILGSIATVHALSDLYAKGANPLTGLITFGVPLFQVSINTAGQILQGAINKLEEAGAKLLGGHTFASKELFIGLSVTGMMNKTRPVSNSGCRAGDALILTKPLGSGIIVTAQKLVNAGIPVNGFTEALKTSCENVMLELNNTASICMLKAGVNACTDITGFGLIGHLQEMLIASQVSATLVMADIPIISGAIELANQDILSVGSERNLVHWKKTCEFAVNISYAEKMVLFDPQTSGGLLMSVDHSKAEYLLEELRKAEIKDCAIIGYVTPLVDNTVVRVQKQVRN